MRFPLFRAFSFPICLRRAALMLEKWANDAGEWKIRAKNGASTYLRIVRIFAEYCPSEKE